MSDQAKLVPDKVLVAKAQRLYDALKRITRYQSPEWIEKHAWSEYGLESGDEAISMAYENVIFEAKAAIRGMRRPGEPPKRKAAASPPQGDMNKERG